MKNVFFWDIKTQFVPHRTHITSLLPRSAGQFYLRFVVFKKVTLKTPGMSRRGDLVRTDVSEERIAFIVKVKESAGWTP
jgi:hypothetical protein